MQTEAALQCEHQMQTRILILFQLHNLPHKPLSNYQQMILYSPVTQKLSAATAQNCFF